MQIFGSFLLFFLFLVYVVNVVNRIDRFFWVIAKLLVYSIEGKHLLVFSSVGVSAVSMCPRSTDGHLK
jgi:hypothetical protein